MSLVWSKELAIVANESRDVAERLGHTLTSAHLLLCLFTLKNHASIFLQDQQVTADRLLEHLQQKPRERDGTWDRIMRRAQDVAQIGSSRQVTSLHVLVALCSFVDSAAYQLMSQLDVDMATMRNTALSYLTANPVRNDDETVPALSYDALDASAVARVARGSGRMTAARAHYDEPREAFDDGEYLQDEQHADVSPDLHDDRRHARGLREPEDVRRSRRLNRATGRRRPPTAEPKARLYGEGPIARPPRTKRNLPLPPTVHRAHREPPAPEPERPRLARHSLVLNDREFPTLCQFGRNLSLLAFDGEIDRVVGRDAELDQLTDILNKRRSNNPVLVGEPGVGKTAVVEGLAHRILGTDGEPIAGLRGRIVIELEASRLVSGTGLRGSFSERMQELKKEVSRAASRIILFLDELHHWIGVGAGGDGPADGAGELKTALARGEFPCIGATTFDEYRKFIESDPAFARRFQMVRVEEPSPDEAVPILMGIRTDYESHHEVSFEPAAIEAAVRLSHRYMPDRRLPDKAIGVLDLAGSRARRIGAASVGRPLVATIIAEQAGLSPDKLLMNDRERFLNLEEQLMQRIVGHRDVIERISTVLRRNYAGFVSGRPIGSFLLLGPTGVGKTEFAKALAQVLFQEESAMLRLDMTEFMEAHSVARLIGSPPGYVGHDDGGQLTEEVRRRPYRLVLLDEIEKAHPDVLNLLIQILDEGHLSDSRGRPVDFSNTVVLMTSNLGAAAALGNENSRRVGFGAHRQEREDELARDERVLAAARSHFRPELWNRLDEKLAFAPLTRDDVARIARLQLTRSSEMLFRERGIAYTCSADVIDVLIDSGGYDPEMGARPMRRTIERLVEARIAEGILEGRFEAPAELEVFTEEGAICVRTIEAESADQLPSDDSSE